MNGPSRRDVLMGGTMLAAAGTAAALVPRDRLVLMPEGQTLDALVPKQIGPWTYVPTPGIVLPRTEGSLSATIYGDVLSRVYFARDRLPVILVIAYGPIQNDLLQLHRPEVCYSAVGFDISATVQHSVPLLPGVALPARQLVARSDQRTETIVYWTRIGDDLPTSGREQRLMKLRQQWNGYIADGILVRMSSTVEPGPDVLGQLSTFASQLVGSVANADRPALIGRRFAAKLA